MKKLLLMSLIFGIALAGFSQNRAVVSEKLKNYAVKKGEPIHFSSDFSKVPGVPAYKSTTLVEEDIIGATRYDLQTNTSTQNRIHYYEDGTVAGTWTMGFVDPSFADRGTGYNYFDGSNWEPAPTIRIESMRTGWPSYAPYGENGELVMSHDFGPAPAGDPGTLVLNKRNAKGTGIWVESVFSGPGVEISWPRTTTSGIDNSIIQVLSITWPTPNGGPVYEGLDGAILYSRSSDGGATWDPENEILDGMTSDDYFGFSADDYEWAASDGDNIAFLVGDSWFDFFLMKSTDGGDSWEKTVIWENPYPFFNTGAPVATDTFYCVDGSHHLAFDSQGMVHAVFGINRAYSDGAGTFWFPGVGGIGYWNESMPTFSNNLNALSPYGDPGSELIEDYNLIGWAQDINQNGTIDVLAEWGTYYIGFSGMPQIVIDDNDNKYVIFTSVTETFDNGLQNYRHIWARGNYGDVYWGQFYDLTGDLVHIFDECVFPSVASLTDDYFHLVYQSDNEPGLAVRGDEDPYGDNNMNYMKVMKSDIIGTGVEESTFPILSEDVSQNYPNPFTGKSWVNVNIRQNTSLTLEVTNILGEVVYSIPEKQVHTGALRLEIDASNFTSGIYFYTIKAGEAVVTKKMIVD
ncbi:MAG: T9SS type A sorting domain-containing protein [Bacteroidales bacterium]|nr:T9SS type A sorting domain-containing protein [Bacteroidales bacterium]